MASTISSGVGVGGVIVLAVIAFVSYLISTTVNKQLSKNGNKYASAIGVLSFIVSFGLILFAIFLVIISTVPFGR